MLTETRHTEYSVEHNMDIIRQEEIGGRLQYARTLPFSPGSLADQRRGVDHLMTAERYLDTLPGLPAIAMTGGVFTGVPDATMEVLAQVQRCTEAEVHLTYISDVLSKDALQMPSLRVAREIYREEQHRLLYSIFTSKDSFRGHLDMRRRDSLSLVLDLESKRDVAIIAQFLHRRLGLFNITADAAYYLTGKTHTSAYQLLTQSLKWALTAYYLPEFIEGHDRQEAIRNALLLIDSLDLPIYREWLYYQKHNKTFHPENLKS